jgi:hypothetical protein
MTQELALTEPAKLLHDSNLYNPWFYAIAISTDIDL